MLGLSTLHFLYYKSLECAQQCLIIWDHFIRITSFKAGWLKFQEEGSIWTQSNETKIGKFESRGSNSRAIAYAALSGIEADGRKQHSQAGHSPSRYRYS
jgi:hypothetical protein